MKKYTYRKIEMNEDLMSEFGSKGWKLVSVTPDSCVIMELGYDVVEKAIPNLMPVAKTIQDPGALYRCQDKVKRYDWGNTMVPTEFLTIDEFKTEDFYTDDGEYEAFLSDGFYFLGTDISVMNEDELDKFIEENKSKFLCPDQLKVYYIDYPEDK